MKKLIFVLLALCAMSGMAQKNGYTINGRVDGKEYKGCKVYIYDNVARKYLDSAVIAKGQFVLKGVVEEPAVVVLVAKGTEGSATLDVVLEPGKIYADLISDSLSGTRLNDRMHRYNLSCNNAYFQGELMKHYSAYVEAKSEAEKSAAEKAYDEVDTKRSEQLVRSADELYKENKDNVLGAFAMAEVANSGVVDLAGMERRLVGATERVMSYPPLASTMKRMRCVEATSAGKRYTDFECLNYQTGEMCKLSDLVEGKVVLVDFWASWCGPCRHEIKTNLIRLWDTYKDNGLLILGVDVWDKPERHKKAVEELGIKYPQVVDNTRNSTEIYGVEGIPFIMLIGPDGTILARDIRGEEIEVAVRKALGL